MKVKLCKYRGSTEGRVHDFSGASMVEHALDQAVPYHGGTIEQLEAKVAKLACIVGRLMEKLPESEWLDVVELYAAEEVK